MKKIFSVLVENKSGVLSRIAGLFSRRGFNIDSLVVGETEDADISRMTIVSSGDEKTLEQVEKQLNKLIDVIKVVTLEAEATATTRRELALIKVVCEAKTRGEILDISNIMGAEIVDLAHEMLTLEFANRPEKLNLLIEMLTPYGIVEIARTGMVALQKGSQSLVNKTVRQGNV